MVFKILMLPYNKGNLANARVDLAPKKILECIKDIYASEDGEYCDFSIEQVDIDASDFTKFQDDLTDYLAKKFKKSSEFVIVGGDHSLSYSSIKAFCECYKNVGLIWLDAHIDATNYFKPVTHEDVIKVLIKDDILSGEDIFMAGIRDYDPREYKFATENISNLYRARDIYKIGFWNFIDKLTEFLDNKDKIYLSFDIDAVDPAYAPGTYFTEPGGFTSREAIEIVNIISRYTDLMDIVEVDPTLDVNSITSKLAAKLIVEYMTEQTTNSRL